MNIDKFNLKKCIQTLSVFVAFTTYINQAQANNKHDFSKAYGYYTYKEMQDMPFKIDYQAMLEGMNAAHTKQAPPMSNNEYSSELLKHTKKAITKQKNDNLAAADNFLEKNKSAKNIHSLNNNKVQYIIIKEGNGQAIARDSTVQIKYTGKFMDGTEFTSSKNKKNGVLTMPMKTTFPGFKLGLEGMREGEIRKIFIHPSLGYPSRPGGRPNSLLVFSVELVKINKAKSR